MGPRDVLFGTIGMPCVGPAPAGRQAAAGGRAVQPAASRLCSCSPQHSDPRRERPEQGTALRLGRRLRSSAHPVPACARGCPEPVPAVLGAGPSCACSWQKHLSRWQSSPHLPQRLSAPSCHPCPGKCPVPAVTAAPDWRRAEEWSLPAPGEGCWPLGSVNGLCCATEEGCAGWEDPLSQHLSLCHLQPPTAAFGLLFPHWCRGSPGCPPRGGGRGMGL